MIKPKTSLLHQSYGARPSLTDRVRSFGFDTDLKFVQNFTMSWNCRHASLHVSAIFLMKKNWSCCWSPFSEAHRPKERLYMITRDQKEAQSKGSNHWKGSGRTNQHRSFCCQIRGSETSSTPHVCLAAKRWVVGSVGVLCSIFSLVDIYLVDRWNVNRLLSV